jgi:hypothetical protein
LVSENLEQRADPVAAAAILTTATAAAQPTEHAPALAMSSQ